MGGSNTLNEGESQMVNSSAGGQVKSTAVARLYMSQGNSWAYSHLWGAAALVAVDGTPAIKFSFRISIKVEELMGITLH